MFRLAIPIIAIIFLFSVFNAFSKTNTSLYSVDTNSDFIIAQTPELLKELEGKPIGKQLTVLYGKFEPVLERSDSLLGPDHNNNGIRDDIEVFIDVLVVSEPAKKAIRQEAKQFQRILSYDFSKKTTESLSYAIDIGKAQLSSRASMEFLGINSDDEVDTIRLLIAFTYNTRLRAYAYLAWKRNIQQAYHELNNTSNNNHPLKISS
ncbi:chromosome partitioning protein ParA [uncultured Photobacterium sp.]|uniref:chromosome partitioning protein ParA n=1 Tax=uncultured Photobacterium sp. TaxID=173973 RepID=UPI002625970F|nr:chromosome partitioning protein ParA [uncultured Photobacterium sp.]